MEILDFMPLIYISVGLTATYFIGKLILGHMTQLKKVKRGIEVQKEKKSFENGLEDLIDNSPEMYVKVMQELEHLKTNGADEKQMSSLQRKADLLKMVVENQEIINLAGKPLFRVLGKFVGNIGR